MRYLLSENPYIWCRFNTGDSPVISIYDSSDNSVIVNAAAMTELAATGYFKYYFNPSPASLTDYFYIASTTNEEQPGAFVLGGYPDTIKTQTDKMNFTGTDIKATLDGEETVTDAASRTASKATGFSTHDAAAVKTAMEAEGTSDLDAIADAVAHADYGLAKLVRSTTPANTLDVSATGEVNAEDSVCDAILTGANHNTVNSLGRRIRELETLAIESGTAQAGSATSITLAATVNLADNVLDRNLVVLTDNTGKGQTRSIAGYNDTTKVCIVDHDWDVVPDNTTAYQIMPSNTPLVVDHGQAQGGTATTVTLRASASATNNIFQNSIIAIVAGTGQGQARLISAYNGATKVATINAPAWVVNPDATSIYGVMPYGVSCACNVSTDVLSSINTEIDTALSDINLDHLCKIATAGADMTTEVADNTILSRVLSNGDTSVFAPSTDGLQPIRDRGDAGWVAATGFSTHSAADVLAATVEGTLELKQAMQAIMAFCATKVAGGGTTTITFRDHADSKNRLVMTVDANGDRSAITYSFD